MAMKIRTPQKLKMVPAAVREEGYTLVETIVALALFVSVLLSFVTIMGNFMFDHSSHLLTRAMQEAVSEISTASCEHLLSDSTRTTSDGLIVERQCTLQNGISIVEVKVAAVKKPDVILVNVHKSFLSQQ